MTNDTALKSLIKKIYTRKKQSVWTVTLGKKQSGKTNFNLRQMELLNELGLADGFGSNLQIVNPPFEIDFIEDFQTLKKRCQMLNPDPEKHGIKRYFFFGSEMGKWLPRDQPWRNVKFIEELQLVRKIGLNWLGDGINRIDERVVNETHFDGIFRKVSITRPDIAQYYNFANKQKITIHNIKKTSLNYNTWESCNFYMEPQTPDTEIPLNADHKIVKLYLDSGCSIAKTGLHSQEVKRARDNVLKYYFKHHLQPMKTEEIAEIEESSTE
jgi:hypothetical protein